MQDETDKANKSNQTQTNYDETLQQTLSLSLSPPPPPFCEVCARISQTTNTPSRDHENPPPNFLPPPSQLPTATPSPSRPSLPLFLLSRAPFIFPFPFFSLSLAILSMMSPLLVCPFPSPPPLIPFLPSCLCPSFFSFFFFLPFSLLSLPPPRTLPSDTSTARHPPSTLSLPPIPPLLLRLSPKVIHKARRPSLKAKLFGRVSQARQNGEKWGGGRKNKWGETGGGGGGGHRVELNVGGCVALWGFFRLLEGKTYVTKKMRERVKKRGEKKKKIHTPPPPPRVGKNNNTPSFPKKNNFS